jgi:hypothetical protein
MYNFSKKIYQRFDLEEFELEFEGFFEKAKSR